MPQHSIIIGFDCRSQCSNKHNNSSNANVQAKGPRSSSAGLLSLALRRQGQQTSCQYTDQYADYYSDEFDSEDEEFYDDELCSSSEENSSPSECASSDPIPIPYGSRQALAYKYWALANGLIAPSLQLGHQVEAARASNARLPTQQQQQK